MALPGAVIFLQIIPQKLHVESNCVKLAELIEVKSPNPPTSSATKLSEPGGNQRTSAASPLPLGITKKT